MSQTLSPALRDLSEPGWREREATRHRAFAEFFAGLPPAHARLAAAIVADRDHATATVEPIAVVDFYPEAEQP